MENVVELKDKNLHQGESTRKRAIYLLPNLLTASAMFCGFYAIVAGMRSEFDIAAMAIFVAMLCDTLDGRIARLTNTQSAFGAQFDSMADIVSFGVAPALVLYNWGLVTLGKPGWMIAFFYTTATALRLARFNTFPSTGPFFIGFPCTSAAGFLAGFVWVSHESGLLGANMGIMAAVITLTAAMLMVSNIPYHTFKQIDFKANVPFVTLLAVILFAMIIMLDPAIVLWAVFSGYLFSGPILSLKKAVHSEEK